MYNHTVATRYAKSLYGLAKDRGEEDTCLNDMQYLYEVCEQSEDFENLVKSPIVNPEKKEEIFDSVLKGKISELSLAFVQLMTRKGREKNLKSIASAYGDIYNKDHKIKILHLTTATKLENAEVDKIISKVKSQVDADEMQVEVVVDEELIGGFVVQVEDKLFDASVKRDLEDIKKQFSKNSYVSSLR